MKPVLVLLILGYLLLSGKTHPAETKNEPEVLSLMDSEYPALPLTPVSELF